MSQVASRLRFGFGVVCLKSSGLHKNHGLEGLQQDAVSFSFPWHCFYVSFQQFREECSGNGTGHNDMREGFINWEGEEKR